MFAPCYCAVSLFIRVHYLCSHQAMSCRRGYAIGVARGVARAVAA
jgi:hypothetical protein